MSRHAIAAELQKILEDLQRACARGEQLAKSSGLVDPKWFRGAMSASTMAAGELEQKGLLQPHAPAVDSEVG